MCSLPLVRVIGLTGGIASGKSAVAGMLRDLGAPVVDADLIARQVVEPGAPALADIVERFGAAMVGEDGRLDRKRLADEVFSDLTARRDLNAITHPRIAQASAAAFAELAAAGHTVAIYEAALLVENRAHERLDGLIVVAVPEEVQLERLRARDGIDAAAARARLAAQLPLSDKIAVADWVIDNSGSLEETRARVADVWRQVREGTT
ncbi:MAG TPA: dephospho-CoA kinase [Kofleriaceae bacterium]|nr:dephospho-CoA kinase [Kofleriaceae bacterium]